MATLITGAGLVGTAFAHYAKQRTEKMVFLDSEPRKTFLQLKSGDADVTLIRKDVRDLPALIAIITDYHIDTIVHTAGLIGKRVADSVYMGFQINLGGTLNVAEAVRLTGVKRLVHISTFGVYDWRRNPTGPIKESFPRGNGGAYANLKVAKEVLLEAYQQLYGFELIVLRPANVFGLGHFWSGSGGGEKMQTLLQSGLQGKVAKIPLNQTMSNEYIYSKDVGKAVDLAATVPLPAETIFNIGNGEVTPFEEIVNTVKKFIPDLQIEIIPGKAPGSRSQHLDISYAKEYLGWEPQFSLEEAFQDYIEDFKAVGPDSKTRLLT